MSAVMCVIFKKHNDTFQVETNDEGLVEQSNLMLDTIVEDTTIEETNEVVGEILGEMVSVCVISCINISFCSIKILNQKTRILLQFCRGRSSFPSKCRNLKDTCVVSRKRVPNVLCLRRTHPF